jgi:hypothetical protein
MNNDYFNNLECIKTTQSNFQKRKFRNKALKYLYFLSFFSLINSLVILCFLECESNIKSIFGYTGLFSALIMFFLFKKVIRNHIFYRFNDFPYQNPNSFSERPYSYVECQFKRGSINERFNLQNKFLSDQDALDFLIYKVEIEFDEWCLDKSNKEIVGYILKDKSFNEPTDSDLEVKFKIKNTRPFKILS